MMTVEELTHHVEEVEVRTNRLGERPAVSSGQLTAMLTQGVWQCALQLARLVDVLSKK